MDQLFTDSVFREEDTFWYEVVGNDDDHVPVVNQSAFRPYKKKPDLGWREKASSSGGTAAALAAKGSSRNVKRKMVDLLRRVWEEKKRAVEPERERGRRHMMNERLRREKQKQSYLALHSLLPVGTKNDKNSIVQSAVERIQDLQRYKRDLERRIRALDANLTAITKEIDNPEGKKIRIRVPDPTSGIDSIEEVLKCLKNLGTRLKTIQAKFSPQELSATLNIQTQIAGDEVEKLVERTLQEAEWNLLFLPEA